MKGATRVDLGRADAHCESHSHYWDSCVWTDSCVSQYDRQKEDIYHAA